MMGLDLTEFDKLEQILQDAGIKYERVDDGEFIGEFHQLRHPERCGPRWIWDVVCNEISYGHEEGLLEIWGKNMIEPVGELTAEECFGKIKEILVAEIKERFDKYERSRKKKADRK